MDEENGFDSNSTPKDPLIETDESIERHMVCITIEYKHISMGRIYLTFHLNRSVLMTR